MKQKNVKIPGTTRKYNSSGYKLAGQPKVSGFARDECGANGKIRKQGKASATK
jgi:hypothetical protein